MSFKILSIDGGGIKGVFPAAFLAAVEARINARVVDYFDFITGTSAGGIVALGLGLGKSAVELRDFYVRLGPKVFRGGWVSRLRHLSFSKYNPKALQTALVEVFGACRLGESKTRLMIPALNRDTGDVYIYKTSHHPRLSFDYLRPAVEVAMATAAAPSYFPAHVSAGSVPLIDGGMWANNPAVFAVIEAMGMCGQLATDIEVLSLGCTETALDVTPGLFSGIGYWALKARDVFMAGQSSSSLGAAKILLGDARKIVRISPVAPAGRYSIDGDCGISSLIGLGEAFARKEFPAIEDRFFKIRAQGFVPHHKLA
ncbi:MAG: CBASS cGAMP-activated phospholipase [Elusimicrobiota bacterium]|jgi:hypothetical protein